MTKPIVKKKLERTLSRQEVESALKDFTLKKVVNDTYDSLSDSISLSWKDVSYTITDPKSKKKKHIVKNVSGIVEPGEVLAIMGPSGAGKSSFLDLLAGRKDPKSISGEIYLNGKPGEIKYVSTYVMQDDALMGVLTVRENIQFAADLCFPAEYSLENRKARVQTIIEEFGLERVADSKIGTVFVRGISGGEKRRCAIASQVLTLPKIIFLDEPTTGLDSAAAYNVMNAIVDMARKHKLTVIASIHQPSTETYSLFDKLLLLGRGKTLYFGKRENAITHFEKLGYACPPYANPADYFLRLVNSDFMKDINEAEELITSFNESFLKSTYKLEIDSQIDNIISRSVHEKYDDEPITEGIARGYPRNFFAQTMIIMKRSLKNSTRNILMYWIRVAMYVSLAILMGSTWWQVGYEQQHIGDRLSSHFFSVAFLCFMSVAGIPGFLEERLVFQRERSNRFYSVGPYVLANTLISIPFLMIVTISFSVFAYPMIGLQGGMEKVTNFLIYLFLSLLVAESMVVFISAVIPIFVAALAIVAFANGFFMVVEGYFVSKKNIPKAWKWAHYVDYQKYAFEGIVKNDLTGLTFLCEKTDQPDCFCLHGGQSASERCNFSGQDILDDMGYGEVVISKWVIALIGLVIAFRVGIVYSTTATMSNQPYAGHADIITYLDNNDPSNESFSDFLCSNFNTILNSPPVANDINTLNGTWWKRFTFEVEVKGHKAVKSETKIIADNQGVDLVRASCGFHGSEMIAEYSLNQSDPKRDLDEGIGSDLFSKNHEEWMIIQLRQSGNSGPQPYNEESSSPESEIIPISLTNQESVNLTEFNIRTTNSKGKKPTKSYINNDIAKEILTTYRMRVLPGKKLIHKGVDILESAHTNMRKSGVTKSPLCIGVINVHNSDCTRFLFQDPECQAIYFDKEQHIPKFVVDCEVE
ncbi:14554_t:CDS:2 [Funneliformis geosporum]|nr:14554_t:CDS:2 [Funneliformis geosporum]